MKEKILPLLLFLPTVVLWGAITGGLIAARLMPPAADGWSQLNQFFGGVMLGGAIALVVGVALGLRLAPRALLRGAAFSLAAAAVLVAVLVLTRPMRSGGDTTEPSPPPSAPKPATSPGSRTASA